MAEKSEIFPRIDPLHQQDIDNKEHTSIFFKTFRYSLLVARFFRLGDEELVGVSTPFLIFDDEMYQYDREHDSFIEMKEGFHSIHASIEQVLHQNEELIERYVEEVDRLEDSLYTRKLSPIFLDVWFDLKKDLTRMDRLFERTEEAMRAYMQHYVERENFPMDECLNIIEHIRRYQRMAGLNTIKLDTLYNYYNSLKNDKINNNIYTLTILSGIFLPLNLIVGFFGMNTEGLFFSGNAEGTMNVIWILGMLFFLLLAIFPLVRLIEHYILSKILGRFNLYHNLVDNIKKFSLFNKE